MLLASNHSCEVVICQSHTMKTTGQLDLSGWFPSVGSRWPPLTVPEPPEVGKGGDLKDGWRFTSRRN